MASAVNLNIYQGDDYAADITVTESDGLTPADLTGYTAQAHIRQNLTATGDPIAEFACMIAGNVITIILEHDLSKLLVTSPLVWDLQIIDASGWITTLVAGQVLVTKEVTKLYEAVA